MLAQIDAAGFTARKGQIMMRPSCPRPGSATAGMRTPGSRGANHPRTGSPAKRRQKDVQARWSQKRGQSHYGYKNHISVDNKHKVIRKYAVTSAEVHDSQIFEPLLDEHNSSGDVWADSAYRDQAREQALPRAGYRSHIHRMGSRKRALNEREQEANCKRSTIRARVKVKIGLMNLVYNMRRLAWLAG